jgi:hypothetical protein
LLRLFGCFDVFPKETRRGCDVDVSLPQLTLHPERYKGTTFGKSEDGISSARGEIDGLSRLKRESMAEQRGMA